jgi:hypothetical protein
MNDSFNTTYILHAVKLCNLLIVQQNQSLAHNFSNPSHAQLDNATIPYPIIITINYKNLF